MIVIKELELVFKVSYPTLDAFDYRVAIDGVLFWK